MNKVVVWTPQEFLDGECDSGDIGKPKSVPENEARNALNEAFRTWSLDPVNDADLVKSARDAIAIAWRLAESHPGGLPGYLQANPDFHKRLLLLGARIPIKPPDSKTSVTLNLSWVGPERLSYRQNMIIDEEKEQPSVTQ